jgi:Skp family chaperone for outer membrane proteins
MLKKILLPLNTLLILLVVSLLLFDFNFKKEKIAYVDSSKLLENYQGIVQTRQAATEIGNIVYADQAIDITDQVLEELNDSYSKEKNNSIPLISLPCLESETLS